MLCIPTLKFLRMLPNTLSELYNTEISSQDEIAVLPRSVTFYDSSSLAVISPELLACLPPRVVNLGFVISLKPEYTHLLPRHLTELYYHGESRFNVESIAQLPQTLTSIKHLSLDLPSINAHISEVGREASSNFWPKSLTSLHLSASGLNNIHLIALPRTLLSLDCCQSPFSEPSFLALAADLPSSLTELKIASSIQCKMHSVPSFLPIGLTHLYFGDTWIDPSSLINLPRRLLHFWSKLHISEVDAHFLHDLPPYLASLRVLISSCDALAHLPRFLQNLHTQGSNATFETFEALPPTLTVLSLDRIDLNACPSFLKFTQLRQLLCREAMPFEILKYLSETIIDTNFNIMLEVTTEYCKVLPFLSDAWLLKLHKYYIGWEIMGKCSAECDAILNRRAEARRASSQ